MADAQITHADSQAQQLRAFLEEQDASEDRVILQPARTLAAS
jgi:hypothetical protein